jgi:hypothetical protein
MDGAFIAGANTTVINALTQVNMTIGYLAQDLARQCCERHCSRGFHPGHRPERYKRFGGDNHYANSQWKFVRQNYGRSLRRGLEGCQCQYGGIGLSIGQRLMHSKEGNLERPLHHIHHLTCLRR